MKTSHRMRKASRALAVTISGALLSACGGVTVEGDSSAGSASTVVKETSTASTAESETSTSKSTNDETNRSTPRDSAASEVPTKPDSAVKRSPQEEEYLDRLRNNDIDVTGVEDQLIATANTVCQANSDGTENITVDAVAGQLVVQGKTKVTADQSSQISKIIHDSAEQTYC